MRIAFGPFVLDTDTRELLRGDESLHITPKALRLLELLIEERPRAVTKEVLIERLWPEQFIADTNLASLAAELRKTLGDRAREPRYLRTVHRHGYAFCGTASSVSARAQDAAGAQVHHRLFLGTREIALVEGENLLGRDPEATVWLDHVSVSRRHARVVVAGAQATLEDLGSKNGTFRDGDRATGSLRLADHDRLRLGSMELIYRCLPVTEETKTAHSREHAEG